MEARVLLVEDSPTQAVALRELLEDAGLTVRHAASGEEALVAVDEGTFDVIISDVMMPGMSGYDLCRTLKARQDKASLPFILLTSLSDPKAIVRGLECGADNYVTKPYTSSHLLARIRNTLDKSMLRPESKTSLGVSLRFLDTTFTITSDRDQILDLFISSVEDVVRANDALQASQHQLAEAQRELERFAERMAFQAQLSSEKYAALMRSANDAIFVLDDLDRISEANIRTTELLGLPADELRQRTIHDLTAPASQPELRDQFARLEQHGRVSALEIEFLRADGDHIRCDVSLARVGTDQGNLTLAILHDVTERHRAAELLRSKEAQLANAQQVAHLGSFELDLATNSLIASDELYRILGRTPETLEATLEGLLDCVQHDDRAAADQAARSLLDGTARTPHECRVVGDDGSVRHVQVRAQIRGRPSAEARLLGTIQDVSDWKRLEQQLQQSQKMEAMGRLAGGIAHDFNNLLTVITSYSDFVLADLEPQSLAYADVSEIRRAAASAATLTRQLLAFSRKQVIQPRPFDIREAVRSFEKILRRIVREDIELVVRLGGNGGNVLVDPGQIEQVLLNLAVNAQDAMPEGGRLTIETSTAEVAEGDQRMRLPAGAYQRVVVSDTGAGMEDAIMAQIFEPFFTTKSVGQGTGLGLSTVHGIVKQAGGEIVVSSSRGRGSTFEILLPLIHEPVTAEGAVVTGPTVSSRPATILVVEDEPGLRVLARRVLQGRGYEVMEARNGDEALAICSTGSHHIDLVLTDVVMPGMDVRAMVERLTGVCAGLKVVYMSGYTDSDIMRHGLSHPDVAFLQKPFSPETLAAKVREVLGSSEKPKVA